MRPQKPQAGAIGSQAEQTEEAHNLKQRHARIQKPVDNLRHNPYGSRKDKTAFEHGDARLGYAVTGNHVEAQTIGQRIAQVVQAVRQQGCRTAIPRRTDHHAKHERVDAERQPRRTPLPRGTGIERTFVVAAASYGSLSPAPSGKGDRQGIAAVIGPDSFFAPDFGWQRDIPFEMTNFEHKLAGSGNKVKAIQL